MILHGLSWDWWSFMVLHDSSLSFMTRISSLSLLNMEYLGTFFNKTWKSFLCWTQNFGQTDRQFVYVHSCKQRLGPRLNTKLRIDWQSVYVHSVLGPGWQSLTFRADNTLDKSATLTGPPLDKSATLIICWFRHLGVVLLGWFISHLSKHYWRIILTWHWKIILTKI